jgi:hypothetical protein
MLQNHRSKRSVSFFGLFAPCSNHPRVRNILYLAYKSLINLLFSLPKISEAVSASAAKPLGMSMDLHMGMHVARRHIDTIPYTLKTCPAPDAAVHLLIKVEKA